MTETERIGLLVCQLRKEKAWTQQTLASKAGLTQQQVGKIEKGYHTANIETLAKVANAFGLKINLDNNAPF